MTEKSYYQNAPEREELENELDVEVPEGWTGGNVWHSGGGIWVREFQNDDLELRVTYNLDDSEPGVGLESIEYCNEYDYHIATELVEHKSEPKTDREKFEAAVELMEGEI